MRAFQRRRRLSEEYEYPAVPLVLPIVFALLGLELMAAEIEDPFGLDCNNLPTGAIADVIELLGLTCPSRGAVQQGLLVRILLKHHI